MALSINKLAVKKVDSLIELGRHADGGNLYLSISKTGAKSWVSFYRLEGRQRDRNRGYTPVLQPLWTWIAETASRLRSRSGNILDAARAKGLYQGENPAC